MSSNGTTVDDGYFTLVQNTDPYTFLGNRPLHVTGAAGLEAPLAALTMRTLGLPTLLGVVGSALGFGKDIGSFRHVDQRAGLESLTITSDVPFPYQVDGDHLGEVTELEFRHEPDAIRLVIP